MLLSIDVGFAKTGWSVFDGGKPVACGLSQQPKAKKKSVRTADDNVSRAGLLVTNLREVIDHYGCKAVIGELPSGGAQNAVAMRDMAAATAAVAGLVTCLRLPCEWCTPTDVKLAAVGLKSATKREIMLSVCDRYNWVYTLNERKSKKGKITSCYRFNVLGVWYPGGVFEDIADSIAAYWALQSSNMVKMFG